MRLKRVKIFGFKTFADKTEFDVEGGLVAVVGPNGCGKSNLVDAILWGLGEANARNLRAVSSQDVIFSGSADRKPIGYAEVTLLFDNGDGVLPVPTSEVTITRRLTRAGESEYLINRQSCRQRDVYELLADSGLGRSGYAIVGQKEIDQALSASPEERRAWVDEAAGVVRYRTRKLEAERRLASARTHLERVEDILRELEVQREPLREEATVARAYKSALEALRSIERGMLIKEVATAAREVESLKESIDRSTALAHAENQRAEQLDTEVRAIGEAVSELEREMDAVRNLQQSSLTAVERALAEVRLAEERLRGLDEVEKTLRDESSQVGVHLKDAEQDVTNSTKEEAAAKDTLAELKQQAFEADSVLNDLTQALTAAETGLKQAREIHARRLRFDADMAHRKEKATLLRRELKGIFQGLEDMRRIAEEAAGALSKKEAAHLQTKSAQKDLELQIQAIRDEEAQTAAKTRALLAERASLEGRKRGLEATIDAFEGLPQGPRAVLEAAKQGLLSGSYRPVGESIIAKKELAVAIETALGGSSHDLIVERDADAKAAIAYLKENRLGRATFQPIPLMRPSNVAPELEKLCQRPGVLGRASELVEFDGADEPVIETLLGRVLIVKDLDTALSLAKTSGWNRVVSLQGEIVHREGAVTGGAQAKSHYGLVQRRADLAEIEAELAKQEKALANAETEAQSRREGAAAHAAQLESCREAISAAAEDVTEAAELAHALKREHEDAIKSQVKIEREIDSLAIKPEEAIEDVDLGPIEQRRDAARDALANHQGQADQFGRQIQEAEARWKQAQLRRAQAQKRLEIAGEADTKRRKRLEGLEPERQTIRTDMQRHEVERVQAAERAHEAEVRLAALLKDRGERLERSLDMSEEAASARKSALAIGEGIHQAALNRARADSRRANALQRLVEDYSLDEEDALSESDAIDLPPDAASVVGKLRRELKGMGDVNLGAIEAFERLTERCDELSVQRDDVLGGMIQVEDSIRQLDHLTRDRFQDTFRQLETTFSEYFAKLFGGGSGEVSLTNPDSLLESGVELEVTLPGKKRQPLALLSGGERSLCGAAFLFGLLKIKPSPLVVLDEVDAPLDGRNVERFADLLREFSEKIQFLVITHNHATILRADVFLGVSMQEPGVSILVPVKLAEPPTPAVAVVSIEETSLVSF